MTSIFALLLLLVVLAPTPVLAIAVVAVRLCRAAMRQGGAGVLVVRAFAAGRYGIGRPVWPGLIAVAIGAGALTSSGRRAPRAARLSAQPSDAAAPPPPTT